MVVKSRKLIPENNRLALIPQLPLVGNGFNES